MSQPGVCSARGAMSVLSLRIGGLCFGRAHVLREFVLPASMYVCQDLCA